jgi:hypothetical protein
VNRAANALPREAALGEVVGSVVRCRAVAYRIVAERTKRLKSKGIRAGALFRRSGPLVPDGPCHALDPETRMTACGLTPGLTWHEFGDWDTANFVEKCPVCRLAVDEPTGAG